MPREIEIKYDVAPDTVMPDLSGIDGVADVTLPVEHDLVATYWDTVDLALVRSGQTLRRREGGEDAGWHLKRPAGGTAREEVHAPIGEADGPVPAELLHAVRVHVRDRDLVPVVRISNRRVVRRLLDERGTALAEVVDDHVVARGVDPAQSSDAVQWREWEAELLAGDERLLGAVGERLEAGGATPATGPSKLRRALGDRLPRIDAAVEPTARGPAGAVTQAHLREQVAELIKRDPFVRADVHDALHKMRVATRRLRSALATFRPLYDRAMTDPIRDELKWLAAELGHARDAEVMRDRLLAMLAEQPPELVLGPVARRIELELTDTYRVAHEHVLETLNSDRYFRLLDALDALVSSPPLTPVAEKRASKVLPSRVRSAWKRVREAMDAADRLEGEAREHQLHEVRKAAKRARYAGESLESTFGAPAAESAAAMEELQEVLGEQQDSLVSRDLLRQLGVQANLSGENALTFGRLHALEEASGADRDAQLAAAWKAASAKKLRRWFS